MEMRRLIEEEAVTLRGRIADLTRERQEVTVTWMKDTLPVDHEVEKFLEQEKALSETAHNETVSGIDPPTQRCDMQKMLCLLGALGVKRD